MSIFYHTGDVTRPLFTDSPRIIVHCCNDKGAWGAGVSGAIGQCWPKAERFYRHWARGLLEQPFALGQVQIIDIEEHPLMDYHILQMANLVGQHDIKWINHIPPVRYDALATGLRTLHSHATELAATLHMPRLGAGLAGGDWNIIQRLIQQHLAGLDVHIYDLPKPKKIAHPCPP